MSYEPPSNGASIPFSAISRQDSGTRPPLFSIVTFVSGARNCNVAARLGSVLNAIIGGDCGVLYNSLDTSVYSSIFSEFAVPTAGKYISPEYAEV